MKKLNLVIKHNNEDRELYLTADNMNEMIEKIIDWQTMDVGVKEYYEKKGKLQSELDSGWYYMETKQETMKEAAERLVPEAGCELKQSD
jgi:hypothetical protein